jgi:hypothetical protein
MPFRKHVFQENVESWVEGAVKDELAQACEAYAHDLSVPFSYATNGHLIIEYDNFTFDSKGINKFPMNYTCDSVREGWVRVVL